MERLRLKHVATFVSVNRRNNANVLVVRMESVTLVVLIEISYHWKARTQVHNREEFKPDFYRRESVTSQM